MRLLLESGARAQIMEPVAQQVTPAVRRQLLMLAVCRGGCCC